LNFGILHVLECHYSDSYSTFRQSRNYWTGRFKHK